MGTIFVRASSRAKAYTRVTSNRTRLVRKVSKKGNLGDRARNLSVKLDKQARKAEAKMRGGYLKSGGQRLRQVYKRHSKVLSLSLK